MDNGVQLMPMTIVTHKLTDKSFREDIEAQYVKVEGDKITWWERIKFRLGFNNESVHKHSECGE